MENVMLKLAFVPVLGLVLSSVAFAGDAPAAAPAPAPAPAATAPEATTAPAVDATVVTGKITVVDATKKLVTVKVAENEMSFGYGNLPLSPEIKQGAMVDVTYTPAAAAATTATATAIAIHKE
jgi:hypothetical protein